MDGDLIKDLFSGFRPVTVRRMFGGAGIYCDGLMFALCDEGVIYLKADDALVTDFEKAGSSPFTYAAKGGKRAVMSYWRLPDHLYDDPDELAQWARRAYAAAERAAQRKSGKSRA